MSLQLASSFTTVITGFNTDIEHDGVIYHVQTEDKGLETPMILSLVYSGGAILASKRARYEDLIASGYSDEALAERLTRQHKLICAAIHAGRIEDLKRMSSASAVGELVPSKPSKKQRATTPRATEEELDEVTQTAPVQTGEAESEETLTTQPDLEILRGGEERELLEAESIAYQAEQQRLAALQAELGEDTLVPGSADASIEDKTSYLGSEQTLTSAPEDSAYEEQRRYSVMGDLPASTDGLRITLLGAQKEFRSGDSRVLKVMVGFRTGVHETPVAKAAVTVKVLGTTFRPQMYTAKTHSDGVAAIAAKIPTFSSGRAALLIRAVFEGKETEFRRVILPS